MTQHRDLPDLLERAIAHGPALPAPQERVAAGRAALRRRRRVTAAAGAGVLAAVVVPAALLLSDRPNADRELPPAAPSTSEAPARDDLRLGSAVPVEVDRVTRQLVVEEGVEVERQETGVAEGIVGWSTALELSEGDRSYWVVIAWDESSVNTSYDEVEAGAASFDDWVADQLPQLQREFAPGNAKSQRIPGLTWDGDGFVGSGDTEVVDQVSEVDLGEGFAPQGATTGAALVELDGYPLLALYRELPGVDGQVLAPDGLTLEEGLEPALDELRERYQDPAVVR